MSDALVCSEEDPEVIEEISCELYQQTFDSCDTVKNTDTFFFCKCDEGFENVDGNYGTCTAVDHCKTVGSSICRGQTCTPDGAEFSCSCGAGYMGIDRSGYIMPPAQVNGKRLLFDGQSCVARRCSLSDLQKFDGLAIVAADSPYFNVDDTVEVYTSLYQVPKTVRCNKNFEWEEIIPKIHCTRPDITYVKPEQPYYRPHDKIEVACGVDTSLYLRGPNILECLGDHWSFQSTCKKHQCAEPNIAGIESLEFVDKPKSFEVGTKIEFKCRAGILKGKSTLICNKAPTDQPPVRWNPEELPICEESTLPPPPPPSTPPPPTHPPTTHPPTPPPHPPTIPPPPQASCPTWQITDPHLQIQGGDKSPYMPGDSIKFICDGPTEMVGDPTYKCLAADEEKGERFPKWDHDELPHCKHVDVFDCELKLNSGVISNSEGLKLGESATFQCAQPNYKLSHTNPVTCINSQTRRRRASNRCIAQWQAPEFLQIDQPATFYCELQPECSELTVEWTSHREPSTLTTFRSKNSAFGTITRVKSSDSGSYTCEVRDVNNELVDQVSAIVRVGEADEMITTPFLVNTSPAPLTSPLTLPHLDFPIPECIDQQPMQLSCLPQLDLERLPSGFISPVSVPWPTISDNDPNIRISTDLPGLGSAPFTFTGNEDVIHWMAEDMHGSRAECTTKVVINRLIYSSC
ncbi:unnamed protein product [Bursaphelenchus xylophilus]|nr:unnamed protein product [Bursaphelenchus xylophilus]CAG9118201.1 unnamed protein product [Bursaphelenchus xylophilus]